MVLFVFSCLKLLNLLSCYINSILQMKIAASGIVQFVVLIIIKQPKVLEKSRNKLLLYTSL